MVKGEWAPESAAQYAPPRRSFRPLIAFWLILIGAVVGGAIFLQMMGPTPKKLAYVAPEVIAAEKAAAQARTPAKLAAQKPVAPPVMIGPIPEPNPDLLTPVPGHPDEMIPRIGADGKRAATYYAAPLPHLPPGGGAIMALVVDGLGAHGIDQADSLQAIKLLPPNVDLVISAYADDAELLARTARAAGHECLVSVPMQPGGPATDTEGVLQLVGTDTPAKRTEKLDAALAHAKGCIGATGASDGNNGDAFARFLSAVPFLETVTEIQKTGLIYFDPRSDGPLGPDVRADLVIDQVANYGEPISLDNIYEKLLDWSTFNEHPGVGLISLKSLVGPKKVVSIEEFANKIKSEMDTGTNLVPLSTIIALNAAKPGSRAQ